MATKPQRKSVQGLNNLTAKKLAEKEDSRVKAGYIGETEKLKGSGSSLKVKSLAAEKAKQIKGGPCPGTNTSSLRLS